MSTFWRVFPMAFLIEYRSVFPLALAYPTLLHTVLECNRTPTYRAWLARTGVGGVRVGSRNTLLKKHTVLTHVTSDTVPSNNQEKTDQESTKLFQITSSLYQGL